VFFQQHCCMTLQHLHGEYHLIMTLDSLNAVCQSTREVVHKCEWAEKRRSEKNKGTFSTAWGCRKAGNMPARAQQDGWIVQGVFY
jgi:hypothetical protein